MVSTDVAHLPLIGLFAVAATLLVGINSVLIRIGHLHDPRESATYNLITLQLAESQLREDGIVLDDVHFEYFMRPVNYTLYSGAEGAYLYLINNASVVIGPPYAKTMTAFATIATYWNLPVFSYFSASAALADKSIYQTLVRVAASTQNLDLAMRKLLLFYKWTNVAVVLRSDQMGFCPAVVGAMTSYLNQTTSGVTVAYYKVLPLAATGNDFKDVLIEVRNCARIVIVCMDESPDSNINFILTAKSLNMTGGDYVFLMVQGLKQSINRVNPWLMNSGNTSYDQLVQDAYKVAFILSVAGRSQQTLQTVHDRIVEIGKGPPYNISVDSTADYSYARTLHIELYNAFYLYGVAMNRCMEASPELYLNGLAMFNCSKYQSFKGLAPYEIVNIDGNAERIASYTFSGASELKNFTDLLNIPTTPICDPGEAATFNDTINSETEKNLCHAKIKVIQQPLWKSGVPPTAIPACGFQNNHCNSDTVPTVIVATFIIAALVSLVVGFAASRLLKRRKSQKEMEALLKLPWRLTRSEITPVRSDPIYSIIAGTRSATARDHNCTSLMSVQSTETMDSFGGPEVVAKPGWFNIAMHRSSPVIVSRIHRSGIVQFTIQDLQLLKTIMEIQHENLNRFVGICIDDKPELIIAWSYGSKGSLKSILHNSDIELDHAFKSSIVRDIVKGLEHIHKSPIGCHGFLRSYNCIVTNRWVVQLSDFGMAFVLAPWSKARLIAAEPFAVSHVKVDQITKENDILNFGIILYEVIKRTEMPINVKLAVESLLVLERSGHFLHEPKAHGDFNHEIIKLFKECLDVVSSLRPTIYAVKMIITRNTYSSKNLVDHMYTMMEKYANNMEALVNERTLLLVEQRQRADTLLYQLLPRSVADSLKQGLAVLPETFEQATVFFSDIVGFTNICSASSPMEVVDMLNSLYQGFDEIIGMHDCYKVETIGDAYLVVSGVPHRNGSKHVTEVAEMSLHIMKFVKERFMIPHLPTERLSLRIGIHSGPLAAGVVGLIMPKYCLFGDTVNVASRMESNGEPGKIHVSWTSEHLLSGKPCYNIVFRGEVLLKGKGRCRTYWMERKKAESEKDTVSNQTKTLDIL